MFDIIYRCDFCLEVISEQEYIDQVILRKSPVVEMDLHNYLVLREMCGEDQLCFAEI